MRLRQAGRGLSVPQGSSFHWLQRITWGPVRTSKSSTRGIHEFAGPIEVAKFRKIAFQPGEPLVLRSDKAGRKKTAPYNSKTTPVPLPALPRWFKRDQATSTELSEAHFKRRVPGRNIFNYELIYHDGSKTGSASAFDSFIDWLANRAPNSFRDPKLTRLLSDHVEAARNAESETTLFQITASLRLLLSAMEYNKQHPEAPVGDLYVAQTPLDVLGDELSFDVLPPDLVRQAGKGDIYSSSIWLGIQPTYTPWHRDPNPNLFVQLEGSKSIALLPQARGEAIFREVRRKLGKTVNSRFRDEDMMQGIERTAFLDAIWGEGHAEDIEYVQVSSGDAVFIPRGWWHSVRSGPEVGELNASVNWWFR